MGKRPKFWCGKVVYFNNRPHDITVVEDKYLVLRTKTDEKKLIRVHKVLVKESDNGAKI